MAESGKITLSNGRVFCWLMTGTTVPEVYGWVEESNTILVSGSVGWWRTPDAEAAGRLAEQRFGKERL